MEVATTTLLAAIAAHGLRGSRLELPVAELPDPLVDGLLPRLERHRLVGLAADAAAAGQLRLGDGAAARLRDLHTQAMCTCLHLEATLLDVAEAMSARDVGLRVLKGPATAHLDYPAAELRHFGDLDLLVRSVDTDTAKEVLHGLGFRRSSAEPRPGFDRRFGKGATFVADDGTNVDLHRTFVMGPLGLRVDLDHAWASHDTFTISGEKVEALGPAYRLLAACYNAVVGDATPRLATLRDIAQLCLSEQLSVSDAVEAAERAGGEHVLALGVTTTWSVLEIADIVGMSAWAARYELDEDQQREIALYHDSAAGYAGLSWATARMLPSRERAAFLRALAFPSGGRLGKRGWGLSERWHRAARGYRRTRR